MDLLASVQWPCPSSAGELRKASSTVVTSTWRSLTSINELVHAMFPPLKDPVAAVAAAAAGNILAGGGGGAALSPEPPEDFIDDRDEFRDLNYWSVPPPLILDDPEEKAAK